MADRKITALTALTTPASTDVLPIVDVSEAAAADKNKKITVGELFKGAPDGTESAPGIAFESDDGNGIYLAGTDTVAISTGGTQRLSINASGTVTIAGDLTVSGTTTTVESTTVTIDDKNIELGSVASPTDTTADGGGITLKGATDKTLTWVNSTDAWTFNQSLDVSSTGYIKVASGTSTERDALTASNGMFRYNTTDNQFEGYADGVWGPISGGGGFEVATSPPASPSAGDTYWDSEEGTAYIYYNDGDSSQWVPLVPGTPAKHATGGGTDEVFFENDNTVTTSYTLQSGKNALSAGPITVNSGAVITIGSGQNWVIV